MELRELSSEEVIHLIYDLFLLTIRAFEDEGGEDSFITLLITEDTIDFAVERATLFSRNICHLFCVSSRIWELEHSVEYESDVVQRWARFAVCEEFDHSRQRVGKITVCQA